MLARARGGGGFGVMAHGALRCGQSLDHVRKVFPQLEYPRALEQVHPAPQLPAGTDPGPAAVPPPPPDAAPVTRRRPSSAPANPRPAGVVRNTPCSNFKRCPDLPPAAIAGITRQEDSPHLWIVGMPNCFKNITQMVARR
jgi:hypothetical protein